MYFIVLFFASFSFLFFYKNGTCEAHLEDAPVLPASSSGLQGRELVGPHRVLSPLARVQGSAP